MSITVCALFAITLTCCLAGLYHGRYAANFMQRLGLVLLSFWLVWRITLVWRYGWAYPHESVIALAIALFAIGSISKTWKHR